MLIVIAFLMGWYGRGVALPSGSPSGRGNDPRQPHLKVIAQVGRGPTTEILFGRLPVGDDYAVSLERRMGYLDRYYQQQGGRLAGLHRKLDLRLDSLHVTPYE